MEGSSPKDFAAREFHRCFCDLVLPEVLNLCLSCTSQTAGEGSCDGTPHQPATSIYVGSWISRRRFLAASFPWHAPFLYFFLLEFFVVVLVIRKHSVLRALQPKHRVIPWWDLDSLIIPVKYYLYNYLIINFNLFIVSIKECKTVCEW